MTESRKQFEEWAVSQKWCVDKTGDVYNNTYVGCSWQAWQASRAAVVVRLPDWDCYYTPRQAIEACKDSLTHAGVEHSYD